MHIYYGLKDIVIQFLLNSWEGNSISKLRWHLTEKKAKNGTAKILQESFLLQGFPPVLCSLRRFR